MALLDPKERILDIVFTDRGRQLLAQNQVNFVYYAFSDEGVDYSGSLSTVAFTGSIDNYILRNMSFEETQRKNLDFSSYLYTIPPKSKKVPEFIIAASTMPAGSSLTGSVTLKRSFGKTTDFVQDYSKVKNTFITQQPIAVIVRATLPSVNRQGDYVKYQSLLRFKSGTLT